MIVTGAAGGFGRAFAVAFAAPAPGRGLRYQRRRCGETATMIEDNGGKAQGACRRRDGPDLVPAPLPHARGQTRRRRYASSTTRRLCRADAQGFETITEAEWDRVMASTSKVRG